MKRPVEHASIPPAWWQDSDRFYGCQEITTGALTRPEWEALRHSIPGIGGSEVGTVCGVTSGKYADPNLLLMRKAGWIEPAYKDTLVTLAGHEWEPILARWYEHYDPFSSAPIDDLIWRLQAGSPVAQLEVHAATVKSPEYPFLFANLDRVITFHREREGELGIWEGKSGSSQYAQQHISAIPPQHIFQLVAYLTVTGCAYGEIMQVLDNRQLNLHIVDMDTAEAKTLQAFILERCEEFYSRILKMQDVIDNASNHRQAEVGVFGLLYDSASDLYKSFLTEKQAEREGLAEVTGTRDILELALRREKLRASYERDKEEADKIDNQIRTHFSENYARKMTWEAEPIKSVSFHKKLLITKDLSHPHWE